MDIQIKGLEELTAEVEALSGAMNLALKLGVLKSLAKITASEKSLAARDTGEMAQKTHFEMLQVVKGIVGRTYNNARHAVYNEFGTGQRGAASPNDNPNVNPKYSADWLGMAAQPFMYPGYLQAEGEVKRTLRDAIKRALRPKG
jgi:HK97 gp10 family phage protein